MNPIATEFIEKALADFETARRELAVTHRPNADAVCFHAQQCVEKLLKAILIHRGAEVKKTHNLLYLLDELDALGDVIDIDRQDLHLLQAGAVDYHYPGMNADMNDAREVFSACKRVSTVLAQILGITIE